MLKNTEKDCVDGMYVQVTKGVKISVLPMHIKDSSNPAENIFAFSYTVTIHNMTDSIVQLLERHWIINSGGRQLAEVVGPGVVGVQPTLEPGESYEYTSSAVIEDPIGSMHGSYTFKAEQGDYFAVDIPRFDLLYPIVLH